MEQLQESVIIDWSGCPLVEVNPRKVSGVPILKETRVPAAAIVTNYMGGSPIEEISENFAIPESTVRQLLSYAAKQEKLIRL
jgi:uncharacterized protein (DUF433 family)